MRQRYSDTQRAQALAMLASNDGNLSRTSRATGIPISTIMLWRNTAHKDVIEECNQKRAPLADMFEEYVRVALPVAMEKVKEARANDLMVSVGIAIDKMRLLRDESTNINETRTIEEQAEEIRSELARRGLKLDKAG